MPLMAEQGRKGPLSNISARSNRIFEDEGNPPARLPDHKKSYVSQDEPREFNPEDRTSSNSSLIESCHQLFKPKAKQENSMATQKKAIMEGGIISVRSFLRTNREQQSEKSDISHPSPTTKTTTTRRVSPEEEEKTRSATRNLKSDTCDEKCSSRVARLPDASSKQRGIDETGDYRPPIPFSSAKKGTPPEDTQPRAIKSCPGALAVSGPGVSESANSFLVSNPSDEELSVKIQCHESSKKPGEGSERLITAFLVEDDVERGETKSAPTAKLPLAEATAMADTKTRRRRIILLVSCCLVVGIVGGVLIAILAGDKDPEIKVPTPPSTTLEPTTLEPTTEAPTYQFEWYQVGKDITGSERDEFGRSVSLSRDGNILAVGARMGGLEQGTKESGRVELFSLSNEIWTQFGSPISSTDESDISGQSISLSDNGRTIAISAVKNHKVRVYRYIDNHWNQTGTDIESDQPDIADSFSNSYTSLSGNGLVVAIGAPWKDTLPNKDHGHVRVYEYDSTKQDWVQRGDDINGFEAGDNLGFSTWMNEDGTVLAAGAFQNFREKTHGGYACVYQWTNNVWTTLGDCLKGEEFGDHFGVSVSLSDDASVLAVGADLNDGENGESVGAGHVRVFEWNTETALWDILGNDIDGHKNGDVAGLASEISGDGTMVAVGSMKYDNGEEDSDDGHVRIFQYDSNEKLWEQMGEAIVGKGPGDLFGISVSMAMANNRTLVAIGAQNGGYAQVYRLVQNF